MVEAIKTHLPRCGTGNDALLVLSDIDEPSGGELSSEVGVLVGTLRLNRVNRLNNYLKFCAARVTMGGYTVVSYLPLEDVLAQMRARYAGLLYPLAYLGHFIRYRALPKVPWLDRLYFLPQLAWFDKMVRTAGGGRKRVLSKSEVWGRLAFYGMEVLYESEAAGERYVIAQRVAQPVANTKPSYYAVVALEKVGLDGKVMRVHKVRSMYPFSEFLQKKVFQSHGLSNTGKFKNDFRVTDYGPIIRRSWIDEIPGIFDWLHGELKLVGMRATSPHFLSLYPKDVYDLYTQVKPGLVPPIFDKKTTGFNQIVEIERTYLTKYVEAPVRTDILYFWYTFRDIFIRKVRSS
jgi:lipopolysaccharide/colanic/teichoic acid biosynthesis glycosyltransferase